MCSSRPTGRPSAEGRPLDAYKPSVGSVGDAYDNAMAETFVGSFKTELIADRAS